MLLRDLGPDWCNSGSEMKDSDLKHWPGLLEDSSSGAGLSFKSSRDLNVCYQLLLKLFFFFEFESAWSYVWKCHVYLYLEGLWCSSLWAGWSGVAAVAVNSCELAPTSSGTGWMRSRGWVQGSSLTVPCCMWKHEKGVQKGVTWGGGGMEGEGCDGSQQKLTSRKLFPLQPISGRSLLTYVFPFTLQYVCQRAIAPLTWILLSLCFLCLLILTLFPLSLPIPPLLFSPPLISTS